MAGGAWRMAVGGSAPSHGAYCNVIAWEILNEPLSTLSPPLLHPCSEAGTLLCCELCPRVYHLHCLRPALPRVPKGDWYCPECARSVDLLNIEKILDVRPVGGKEAAGEWTQPGG